MFDGDGIEDEADVIAAVVDDIDHPSDEPVRAPLQQRDSVGTAGPLATSELVGVVACHRAEDLRDVMVAGGGEVHYEHLGVERAPVGVILNG